MLGHHRLASKFRWRAVDDPLKVVFGSFFPLSNYKKEKKKIVVKVGPPLTKLSGSAHESPLLAQTKE